MREASDRNVLSIDTTADRPGGGLPLTLKVMGVVLVMDHLSKWWAQSRLSPGICTPESCVDLFGTPVRFHLIYNTGAAFSKGEGLGWLIGPLALLMAGYLLFLANRTTDRVSLLALGSVAGGAIGNLVDRIIRSENGFLNGGVVDFIDFQFWPVFNVADVAVVGGVMLLLLRQATATVSVEGNELHDH